MEINNIYSGEDIVSFSQKENLLCDIVHVSNGLFACSCQKSYNINVAEIGTRMRLIDKNDKVYKFKCTSPYGEVLLTFYKK